MKSECHLYCICGENEPHTLGRSSGIRDLDGARVPGKVRYFIHQRRGLHRFIFRTHLITFPNMPQLSAGRCPGIAKTFSHIPICSTPNKYVKVAKRHPEQPKRLAKIISNLGRGLDWGSQAHFSAGTACDNEAAWLIKEHHNVKWHSMVQEAWNYITLRRSLLLKGSTNASNHSSIVTK